ncbi:MAG TPA: hypothetical protein VIV15_11130 [Anaerolineales bacterium]
MTCSSCVFFLAIDSEVGRCHFHAPHPVSIPHETWTDLNEVPNKDRSTAIHNAAINLAITFWPIVGSAGFCSEHVDKDEPTNQNN